ncbi:hypothetical protein PTKU64_82470 [Paraburkholderia terrae]|uniref:Transposase n=1 Tax=Paraburkholderia terrae TaxID=311230 RepID=A0ABM7U0Y4_9BURK|nr:hypothetical protein PTKU64_82470 [Paraburkholderia terrae]BDC45823.1 hypothetical protein PTKU15_91200 [Paraburkholderia terrae]
MHWCPITHAHQVLGIYARHQRFLICGESEQYQARLKQFRDALRKQNEWRRCTGDGPLAFASWWAT